MSLTSEYKVRLDIDNQDKTLLQINEMERGFRKINDAAKQIGNSLNVEDTLSQMEAETGKLRDQLLSIAKTNRQALPEAMKAYKRSASKTISALEVEYGKLAYSMTEEGKAQRERLKQLREANDLTKEQKKELSDLSKQVTTLSDAQIEAAIRQNKQMRANLKMAETEAKYASAISGDLAKASFDKIGQVAEKTLATMGKLLTQPLKTIREGADAITGSSFAQKLSPMMNTLGRLPEIAQEWPEKFKNARLKYQVQMGLMATIAKKKFAEIKKNASISGIIQKSFELMGKGIGATFKGVGSAASKIFSFVEKNGKRAFEVFSKGAGKAMNKVSKGLQTVYNAAGLVGGGVRAIKGVGGAFSGAISSVSSAADKMVDREKQATRIKGSMSDEEKQKLLQQVYIKTGADYGVIVDAINAIQNTFGQRVKPDELAQAAAMEIQYPGTASTFLSSTEGESNMEKFNMYANRLKAIQGATGASTEQIQASTKFVSQYANHDTGASVSQLQAVYLAMQNQGVFNSEEELQTAFKRFVSQQAKSGMSPVEFAKQFDWDSYAKGSDGRNRATNALSTMDWGTLNSAATTTNAEVSKDSAAKSMAEKMRELEEKKNEMMMKLIPVIMPVVEELSKLLNSGEGQAIIDGLVGIFKTVLPLLEPLFKVLKVVLDFANDYLLRPLEKAIKAFMDWFGDDENEPEYANGGITSMPSIVGERGPEAIIPLDFSRATRANNVATSITQTFQMTGNQTTALSLAQAVRSRDFTRAMTDNLFITNRCGGF